MADDIKLVIGVDDRDLIKAQKEQLKFQRNIITIEKAFRNGDITAKRYNQELNKQTKELQKLGGSYRTASSEVRKYAYAMRQADDATLAQSQAMAFAGKKINRMGVGLQQAGYQIGDFAVQIQGGTNAAVALGQQGSQLLGIFGPAGAIAGAALAIGTAFIAPLIKADNEAKNFLDTIEGIGSSLDNLSRIRLDNFGKSLTGPVKEAKKEFNDLLRIMEQQELKALREKIEAPLRAVIKELESATYRANIAAQLGADTPAFNSELGLKSQNEAIFLAEQLKRLEGETKEELQTQLESVTEALMLRGILTDEVQQMLVLMAKEVSLTETIEGRIKNSADSTKDFSSALSKVVNEAVRLRDVLQQVSRTNLSMSDKAKVLRAQIAAAKAGRSQAGAEATTQTAITLGGTSATIDEIARLALESGKAAEEVEDLENQLSALLNQSKGTETTPLYEDILGSSEGLNQATEALNEMFGELVSESEKFLGFVDAAEGDASRLAKLDIASGINAAAIEASDLSEDMKQSLKDALGIVSLAKDAMSLDPFGGQGDPFYNTSRTVYSPWEEGSDKTGSKTDPMEGQFNQLEKFLATERELVVMEYESRQLTLEQSLEKGYLAKETYAEMELELERRKQSELGEIEEKTQKAKVSAIAGGIADVLSAAANGNEKILKMARVVGAAEALINTYRAAAQTLADPTLPFYAKFAAVAATVAAGLSLVSSLKSGSSSSASGAAATMPAQAAAPTPQRVIIEGIDRNSLFSGEQLSNIFEAIYEENENRGMVFEVAR